MWVSKPSTQIHEIHTCLTLWDIFEIEVIFFSTINERHRHLGSKKKWVHPKPCVFALLALAVTVTNGQDQHNLYAKRGTPFFGEGGVGWFQRVRPFNKSKGCSNQTFSAEKTRTDLGKPMKIWIIWSSSFLQFFFCWYSIRTSRARIVPNCPGVTPKWEIPARNSCVAKTRTWITGIKKDVNHGWSFSGISQKMVHSLGYVPYHDHLNLLEKLSTRWWGWDFWTRWAFLKLPQIHQLHFGWNGAPIYKWPEDK